MQNNSTAERTPGSLQPAGSAAGVTTPKGVCIVCGSVLLIQYWRGHIGNQRIHCNDCGSEVTPLMHAKKQPNARTQRRRDENAPPATDAQSRRSLE